MRVRLSICFPSSSTVIEGNTHNLEQENGVKEFLSVANLEKTVKEIVEQLNVDGIEDQLVYVKAKECSEKLSVEEFAILLAKRFTSFYRQELWSMLEFMMPDLFETEDIDLKKMLNAEDT
ncbi:hypothetical protein L1887_02299 [Cichorium endivia]|nr:hypothetical protein L1887_02299 [Cichorium endivia]